MSYIFSEQRHIVVCPVPISWDDRPIRSVLQYRLVGTPVLINEDNKEDWME